MDISHGAILATLACIAFVSAGSAAVIWWRLKIWIETFAPEVLLRSGWLEKKPLRLVNERSYFTLVRAKRLDLRALCIGLPIEREDFPRIWMWVRIYRVLVLVFLFSWCGYFFIPVLESLQLWPIPVMFIGSSFAIGVWQISRAGRWADCVRPADERYAMRWTPTDEPLAD